MISGGGDELSRWRPRPRSATSQPPPSTAASSWYPPRRHGLCSPPHRVHAGLSVINFPAFCGDTVFTAVYVFICLSVYEKRLL